MAVFQDGNDAVWLLPAMHIRVLVGSYTGKGCAKFEAASIKVWHNLKITGCPLSNVPVSGGHGICKCGCSNTVTILVLQYVFQVSTEKATEHRH